MPFVQKAVPAFFIACKVRRRTRRRPYLRNGLGQCWVCNQLYLIAHPTNIPERANGCTTPLFAHLVQESFQYFIELDRLLHHGRMAALVN